MHRDRDEVQARADGRSGGGKQYENAVRIKRRPLHAAAAHVRGREVHEEDRSVADQQPSTPGPVRQQHR